MTTEFARSLLTDLVEAWPTADAAQLKVVAKRLARQSNARESTVLRARGDALKNLIRSGWRSDEELLAELLFLLYTSKRSPFTDLMYLALGAKTTASGSLADEEQQLAHPAQWFRAGYDALDSEKRNEARLWIWVVALRGIPAWRRGAVDAVEAIEDAEAAHAANARAAQQTATIGATPHPIESETEQDAAEPAAESRAWDTDLDRVVTGLILDSHAGRRGAPSPDGLDELLAELAALNRERSTTWFHIGYRDAIFGEAMAARTGLDNDERRAWYLAGFFLGGFRCDQVKAMSALLGLGRRDRETLARAQSPQARVIAPVFFAGILESDRWEQVSVWLNAAIDYELVELCIQRARRLLRANQPSKVQDLTDLATDAIAAHATSESGRARWQFIMLQFLAAAALRMRGAFQESAAKHREVLELIPQGVAESAAGNGELFEAHAFLLARISASAILAHVGIRRLEEIDFQRVGERDAQRKALLASRDLMRQHLEGPSRYPSVAMLWVLMVLAEGGEQDGPYKEALKFLDDALDDMVEHERDLWEETGLLSRARAWRALLVILSMDTARVESETHELRLLVESKAAVPPADIVLAALTRAAALGAADLEELAMLYWNDSRPMILRGDCLQALMSRPDFRQRFLMDPTASLEGLLPTEKVKVLAACAHAAATADQMNRTQLAETLDELLIVARNYRDVADDCLAELERDGRWQRCWVDDEFEPLKAELQWRGGGADDAQHTLRVLANKQISESSPEAGASVDLFSEYGGDSDEADAMWTRLEGDADGAVIKPDRTPELVRVHFIGGNEMQERMQSDIRRLVKVQAPWISIQFDHPGWSSNWGSILDKVKTRLVDSDIVVLHRFMRTEFGRALRAAIGKADRNWRASGGHAPPSIARAIVSAGRAVAVGRH